MKVVELVILFYTVCQRRLSKFELHFRKADLIGNLFWPGVLSGQFKYEPRSKPNLIRDSWLE